MNEKFITLKKKKISKFGNLMCTQNKNLKKKNVRENGWSWLRKRNVKWKKVNEKSRDERNKVGEYVRESFAYTYIHLYIYIYRWVCRVEVG